MPRLASSAGRISLDLKPQYKLLLKQSSRQQRDQDRRPSSSAPMGAARSLHVPTVPLAHPKGRKEQGKEVHPNTSVLKQKIWGEVMSCFSIWALVPVLLLGVGNPKRTMHSTRAIWKHELLSTWRYIYSIRQKFFQTPSILQDCLAQLLSKSAAFAWSL